jgi:hypothetical protein
MFQTYFVEAIPTDQIIYACDFRAEIDEIELVGGFRSFVIQIL